MVKSGVMIVGPAIPSLTVLKPSVYLAATRDPRAELKETYEDAAPAVYSMAWIYQLVVTRPLVPDSADIINSKAGAALAA